MDLISTVSISVTIILFAHISCIFNFPVKSKFVPEASINCINLDDVIVSFIVIFVAVNDPVKSKFTPEASLYSRLVNIKLEVLIVVAFKSVVIIFVATVISLIFKEPQLTPLLNVNVPVPILFDVIYDALVIVFEEILLAPISLTPILLAVKSPVKSNFTPNASLKSNLVFDVILLDVILDVEIFAVTFTLFTPKSPLKVIPVPWPFVNFISSVVISFAQISITFKPPFKSKFVPDASLNWICVVDWILVALISFAQISLTFKSIVKSRFVPDASTKSINLDEVMVSLIVISFAFNVSVKSKFVPDASINCIWEVDSILVALISFAQMSLTFKSFVKSRFVPDASTKSMNLVDLIVTLSISPINLLIFKSL